MSTVKRIYLATVGMAALLFTVHIQAATITASNCSVGAAGWQAELMPITH